jgi:hypothetical protein
MGAYKCERHGIQGFTIMCEHVADAMVTQRSLGFELTQPPADQRFARCRACVAAGFQWDHEKPVPGGDCSACFDEWATATSGRPRSC